MTTPPTHRIADLANGYRYTDQDYLDEDEPNAERELHMLDEQTIDQLLRIFEFKALSQEPGTHIRVYWEDDFGTHLGIPTAEQIAMPSHRRIAEFAIHVD